MIVVKEGIIYSCEVDGESSQSARKPMRKDILIGGGRILAVSDSIDTASLPMIPHIIQARGNPVTPGWIDGHQHFTGGGGEGGFATRTPEMSITANTCSGVTTAVGLLGTDALTRSVKNLYAKTNAFNEEGISAFMLTGSYWVPSTTLTGTVSDDIVFLDKCIGLKIAIADHRGPVIPPQVLAQLVSEVRAASLVSGKAGSITVHLGSQPDRVNIIKEVVNEYNIRADSFVITHVNRDDDTLMEDIFDLAAKGAYLDATAMVNENRPNSKAVPAAQFAMLIKEHDLWSQLSFTSDAGGSLPQWDSDKNIVGMGIGDPKSLQIELSRLVLNEGIPLEQALLPLTRTPARIYGLDDRKGALFEGADADVLVLDKKTLEPVHVIAKGKLMVEDGIPIIKGYFG